MLVEHEKNSKFLLDATVHQRSAATFWRKSSPVHCHLESKLGCLCRVLVAAEWLLARCFHRFWRKTVPMPGMRNDAQAFYQECRSMERHQESRNQQCKHDHPVKKGILNFHSLIILTIAAMANGLWAVKPHYTLENSPRRADWLKIAFLLKN